MSQRIPIYKYQDETYRADSCQPLLGAARDGDLTFDAVVHGHYPGKPLPGSAMPGLKTLGYWNAEKQQHWGLDWHQNEGLEICLLERGHLEFAVEDEVHQLQPNDLTITRPWQRHRLGSPSIGPGRLHWIIIDLGVRRPHQHWRWPPWIVLTRDDLDELTSLLRQNEQPVWSQANEVSQCFQRISRILGEQGHTTEVANVSWLKLLINEMLLLLLDLLRSRDVKKDASLADTQRTVELFLDDLRNDHHHLAEEWTLKMMAESCGLGVTRFTEYCRRLTNTTPMQHLNRLRLEAAAKLLLQHSDLSNAQVARACGFSSPQYFATVFRRHYGYSPQKHRLENKD
ncbi:AraC family transcriptional regulator [Rhodopirellula sallentina]|uniref:Transcriptional regulator, AraC family n=1 Tax=Rhodopirellula sallentina SM41 TaxID=1263870 RepID=M5UIV1_9BACT|nr:AraC family transcriptional regulator [Rhodopirellula sallentina]EMI57761.1 transcriptional regulator, AraC family [Rhodopirellula sallentina SM41]